jgi:hypothetical protein
MVYAMEFAERLRALMAARGISERELARRVNCDRSYIHLLRHGKRRAGSRIARLLDDALDAGGKLAAAAQDRRAVFNGAAGADGADRMAWTLANPRRIDGAAVDVLGAVLGAQRRAEDVLGSAAMLGPVAAQLAAVQGLVIEARGPVRPALVHMAGQWAQYAGWLYANNSKRAEGDGKLSQALQWAVEAGEVNLISEVLSFQGHAAWIADQPGPLIGLSQAARRDRSAYPGQLAIAAAQEAQGHAMTGDPREVDRLLDEADDLAAAARDHLDDAPPWLYYHSPGFFQLQRGLACRYLADDPQYRARAAAALEAGHAALPEDERGSEWGAEFLCHLAAVHLHGGDSAQASDAAARAAVIARQTGSPRLLTALRRLYARMVKRWPVDQDVAALGEALR